MRDDSRADRSESVVPGLRIRQRRFQIATGAEPPHLFIGSSLEPRRWKK